MRKWLVLATWCCLVAIHGTARSAPWSPLEIDVWEPPFNTTHQRTQQQYTALTKAAKPWRLCVAIPHLKDAYWLAVNFGLIDEARHLGIALDIVEAGGYEHLDVQRQQVSGCMQQGYDALIIGAVSATGLNDLIAKSVAEGRPVIDLINGIDSPQITARVAADFYDLGSAVGRFIRAQPANPARPVTVAWLPGPQGAGWVAAGDRGFRDSLKGASVSIVDTRYGDTGFAVQGQPHQGYSRQASGCRLHRRHGRDRRSRGAVLAQGKEQAHQSPGLLFRTRGQSRHPPRHDRRRAKRPPGHAGAPRG